MVNIKDEYLSPFYDKTVFHQRMESNPELVNASREICAAFGLQVAVAPWNPTMSSVPKACFFTKEGIEAGSLERHKGLRYSDDPFFVFTSGTIHKERSSTRSQRNQRDSVKITGIITALRKKDEVPTLPKLMNRVFNHGIIGALTTVEKDAASSPSINLMNDEARVLMKYFLEDDKMSIEAHRVTIQNKYKSYIQELEKRKSGKENLERFKKGCKIIGVLPGDHIRKIFYLVGDATFDGRKVLVENLTRYKSLADSPLAADAAMIRTYLESKPNLFDTESELGISLKDVYLPDIDVAVGFRSYNTGTWALLPKHGF